MYTCAYIIASTGDHNVMDPLELTALKRSLCNSKGTYIYTVNLHLIGAENADLCHYVIIT